MVTTAGIAAAAIVVATTGVVEGITFAAVSTVETGVIEDAGTMATGALDPHEATVRTVSARHTSVTAGRRQAPGGEGKMLTQEVSVQADTD